MIEANLNDESILNYSPEKYILACLIRSGDEKLFRRLKAIDDKVKAGCKTAKVSFFNEAANIFEFIKNFRDKYGVIPGVSDCVGQQFEEEMCTDVRVGTVNAKIDDLLKSYTFNRIHAIQTEQYNLLKRKFNEGGWDEKDEKRYIRGNQAIIELTNLDLSSVMNEDYMAVYDVQEQAINRLNQYNYVKEHKDEFYTKFGLEPLDDWNGPLGGLKNDDFGIIFARPNLGKSTLALYMAINFAKKGKKVLYYSGEVRAETLGYKSYEGHIHGLNYRDLEHGNEAISDFYNSIDFSLDEKFDLHIVDYSLTLNELEEYIVEGNYDVTIVDALYHLHTDNEIYIKTPLERINRITDGLQQLVLKLQKPIIAVMQQNREASEEKNVEICCKKVMNQPYNDKTNSEVVERWKSVSLEQISQSDRIGQDASWVINVQNFVNPDSGKVDPSICRLALLKNKRGRVDFDGWEFTVDYQKVVYNYIDSIASLQEKAKQYDCTKYRDAIHPSYISHLVLGGNKNEPNEVIFK